MESQTETPKTSSTSSQTYTESKTMPSQTEPTNKMNSSIGTQTDPPPKLLTKKSMREKKFPCNICSKKFTSIYIIYYNLIRDNQAKFLWFFCS